MTHYRRHDPSMASSTCRWETWLTIGDMTHLWPHLSSGDTRTLTFERNKSRYPSLLRITLYVWVVSLYIWVMSHSWECLSIYESCLRTCESCLTFENVSPCMRHVSVHVSHVSLLRMSFYVWVMSPYIWVMSHSWEFLSTYGSCLCTCESCLTFENVPLCMVHMSHVSRLRMSFHYHEGSSWGS